MRSVMILAASLAAVVVATTVLAGTFQHMAMASEAGARSSSYGSLKPSPTSDLGELSRRL